MRYAATAPGVRREPGFRYPAGRPLGCRQTAQGPHGEPTHDQGCRATREGIAENRFARHQQRVVGARRNARARAPRRGRTQLRAGPVRAQLAQRDLLRARPGLRQPESVLRDQRAERRARRVPRPGLRLADPSLRFDRARSCRRTARAGAPRAPGRSGAGAADVRALGSDPLPRRQRDQVRAHHLGGRGSERRLSVCTWTTATPPTTSPNT